nr:sulfotransferase [Actibacterium sp. MT2.3-13A]
MFFVIGAQKAGTTWLHRYLAQHPEVSSGPLKKYHYFNKFHGEFAVGGARPHFQGLRRLSALSAVLRRAGRPAGYLRATLAALRGRGDYLGLVRGDRPGARAFGDVTPIYSLLGRAAFAEMAASYPRTRFVFIMRDPVDRLWSHVRMRARRLGLAPGEAAFDKMVFSRLNDPRFLGRSDYARTITELEAAVPREQILYLFYEELFSDASLRRLCDFLGLGFVPGTYDEKVFAGISAEAPRDWLLAARAKLAPVYDFVTARFGDAVPAAWRLDPGRAAPLGVAPALQPEQDDAPGRLSRLGTAARAIIARQNDDLGRIGLRSASRGALMVKG